MVGHPRNDVPSDGIVREMTYELYEYALCDGMPSAKPAREQPYDVTAQIDVLLLYPVPSDVFFCDLVKCSLFA